MGTKIRVSTTPKSVEGAKPWSDLEICKLGQFLGHALGLDPSLVPGRLTSTVTGGNTVRVLLKRVLSNDQGHWTKATESLKTSITTEIGTSSRARPSPGCGSRFCPFDLHETEQEHKAGPLFAVGQGNESLWYMMLISQM